MLALRPAFSEPQAFSYATSRHTHVHRKLVGHSHFLSSWKRETFATGWRAVFSNDKPPQPWPRGRPQVRFRAKLQQIGRTVWCRPFGTDSGSLPPAGRASLTSSLTVLIYSTQKEMCTQKAIPPPAVAQSYLFVMSTMTMSWIIRIFPFFKMWKQLKIFLNIAKYCDFFFFLQFYCEGHVAVVYNRKLDKWRTLIWRFFLSWVIWELLVKLSRAQPLQTPLNCLTRQMITPHNGSALAECSCACHYQSFICHFFLCPLFFGFPVFSSKQLKDKTDHWKAERSSLRTEVRGREKKNRFWKVNS